MRCPIGSERDRLSLDHQLACGQGPNRLHQLGYRTSDFIEPSGEDPHLVPALVDLHSGTIELVFERCLAQLSERILLAVCRSGEHGKYRTEELDRESGQP